MLHIKEEYTENPNDNVEDLMDDFAKYLDSKDIQVDYVDYSSKTIYVKTVEALKEARYELHTEFTELRQLGVHIQSSIGTDGLDKDYIKDTKTQTEKLSIKEDFEPYTYVKSKTVYDSDGWTTEYTMYFDEVNDRYVFVFGDSDYYNPNDGYEEFDWECDTEKEANDWFNNYNGFEDDLNESLKEETASLWDIDKAAKQSADAALKNVKQGIEDFEIEINTKLDRPSFWKKFRQEMTENGLDFEIKGKDTEWSDHYYYIHLYNLNIDESCSMKESSTKSYWKYNQYNISI